MRALAMPTVGGDRLVLLHLPSARSFGYFSIMRKVTEKNVESRVIVEVPQQEDNSPDQQFLLHRGGQLVEDIMGDILPKQSSETPFELNLAMFKFKHSVRWEK